MTEFLQKTATVDLKKQLTRKKLHSNVFERIKDLKWRTSCGINGESNILEIQYKFPIMN